MLLITIAVGLAVAGLVAKTAPPKMLRIKGRREIDRVERDAPGEKPSQEQLSQRRRDAAWHDALGQAFVWAPVPVRLLLSRFSRVQRRLADAKGSHRMLVRYAERWFEASKAMTERALLSARVSRFLKALLVVADVVLVAAAIRANDITETVLFSVLAASAIGLTVALSGQLAGLLLKKRAHVLAADLLSGERAIPVALIGALGSLLLAVVLTALGMTMLRGGESAWAWFPLALTPAIGSAIVVILSPDQEELAVWRAETEMRRGQKFASRATRRLARASRRFDRSLGVVRLMVVRDGWLRERMEISVAADGSSDAQDPNEMLELIAPRASALSEAVSASLEQMRELIDAVATSIAEPAVPSAIHTESADDLNDRVVDRQEEEPPSDDGADDWHLSMWTPSDNVGTGTAINGHDPEGSA